MIEKQELYCHGCHQYVQFELDMEVNGNYTLDCPSCGHKHYRLVRDARITDTRWAVEPLNDLPVIHIYATGSSDTSTSASNGSTTFYDLYLSGTNATTGTGWN